MQPVACTVRPKGPWRQLFPVDSHDWHAVPSLGSRQVCAVPLESPRTQWPGSRLVKSYCPSSPSCRTRSLWLRPDLPQGQVQIPWLPEGPYLQKAGFTKSNVDEFENMVAVLTSAAHILKLKTWWQKNSSSWMAVGYP